MKANHNSNIESINSALIARGMSKQDRYTMLKEVVQEQRKTLDKIDIMKTLKKEHPAIYIDVEDIQKRKALEQKPSNKWFWQK